MEKVSFSLLKKAVFALAVILLPIAVSFILGLRDATSSVRTNILDNLSIISEAFEGRVYQFLEMSKRRARDFATDGLIVEGLERNGSGGALRLDGLLKERLRLDGHIHSISVSTPDGVVVASTEKSIIGSDISKEPFFTKGLKGAAVAAKAIGPRMPGLAISAPIKGADDRTIGVLTNVIPLSELELVLSGEFEGALGAISWGTRFNTMRVYIADASARIVAGPAGYAGESIDTPPVRSCLASKREMLGLYRGFKGEDVAGASQCLPSLDWTLLVEVDRSELMQPVHAMRRDAFAVLAAVAALIGLLVALFYRSIIVQLRRLSDAARKMAGGDYAVRLPAGSRDEIGALGAAFNEMASEIERRDSAVREAAARLGRAEHIARMGSWEWDVINDRMYLSEEMYGLLGVAAHEFGGSYESVLSSVHPEDREAVKRSVYSAFYRREPFSLDHRLIQPDGAVIMVHAQGDVSFAASGIPVKMTGLFQDITERKRAEFDLKKLSMAIEGSVNIVFITDASGRIEYVNRMFEEVTGYSRKEAIGQTPRILASGETTTDQYEVLWKAILSGKTWRNVYRNRKKNGDLYWCNSVITPIRDERGKITHFLAVQEDTTERMHSEERARYLESYDGLTGLVNRARFMELLDGWIKSGGRTLSGALLLSDMDQFKFINDAYGYGTGDEFLRRVGKIIEDAATSSYGGYFPNLRPLVGRLSGDEFAVFLPQAGEREGQGVAECLRKAVEEFRYASDFSSTTMSTGIVIYPGHGQDSRDLFTRADAAMYRAKELGRNRSHLFKAEDKDLEKLHSRLAWKEKILKALREDRFIPYFQPILRLKDNRVVHYEALARMIDEDGKVLLPGAFIDVAERFGIIGAIDRAIIKKAMKELSGLREMKEACFSMNLSGKDIGDDDLLDFIRARMEETGVRRGSVVFEITETAAIGDLERARTFTRALKTLGCRFSLDDFGVGFTSFVYLRELNVDYIKIDGSFIRKLHQSPADQVFVKAMSDCAKGLNIHSIAEFVEHQETLKLLRKLGVDYAQGYLIGRPAPSPDREIEWKEPDVTPITSKKSI